MVDVTTDRWDVRLPDGCIVEVARAALERIAGAAASVDPGVRYLTTVECQPGHEPVRVELELTTDGSRLRARAEVTAEPLAVAPHLDEDDAAREKRLTALFAPPEPGEFRVWVDRMSMRRQGRVASVDGAFATVEVPGGSRALVPLTWLELPDDAPPAAPARTTEQVETAIRVAAETGVREAITRVYDVLREADPDGEKLGLQVRAALEVKGTAARLSEEAGRIAAKMQTDTDTGEGT